MQPLILSGSANLPLAETIATNIGVRLGKRELCRFPDGELHVEIQENVRGRDVYLIQSTSPPADEHLLELLLLADACRRGDAGRLTAVIPYFGYARQDRRAQGREAVGGRLVADLIEAGGLQRLIVVDLHTPAVEGFFTVPMAHLTAVPFLADAIRPRLPAPAVIVAPDLGAVKLAGRYGTLLNLPVAIVHKTRLSGTEVTTSGITGEVHGRAPIVVDDMISTGGTIEAAVRALLAAGCSSPVTVVASHGLFVGPAVARLRGLPIQQLLVTDSVTTPELPLPIQLLSLCPLLVEAIARLHDNRSLTDLVARY